MSDNVEQGLIAMAPLIGLWSAMGLIMIVAEIRYRWFIHNLGDYPNSERESFIKYLFMAWFVRGKRYYKRRGL